LASLSPTSTTKTFSFPTSSSNENGNEDFPTPTNESGTAPAPATTTVKSQSGAPLSVLIQEQSKEQKEAMDKTFQRRIRGFSLSNYARPGAPASASANAMLLTRSSSAPGSLQDEEKKEKAAAAAIPDIQVVAASPSPSATPAAAEEPTEADIDTVATVETIKDVKEPDADAHGGKGFMSLYWPWGSATTTTEGGKEEGKDGEASKCLCSSFFFPAFCV
jgi:hypothetical protein